MDDYMPVAAVGELAPGESLQLEVEGHPVLVVNVQGEYCAILDRCPHQGTALSMGVLAGDSLICGAHGWEFHLPSGRSVLPTAQYCLVKYPVLVEDGRVKVRRWPDLPPA